MMTHMRKQGFLKKWWWLICAIFYMPFVVFFYIGKKANNRLWITFGFVYLIIFAVFVILNNLYTHEKWVESFGIVIWLIGFIHLYLAWSQYSKEFLTLEKDEIESDIEGTDQFITKKTNGNRKIKIIKPISFDIYKITTEKPIMTPGVHGCLGCLAKFGFIMPSLLVLIMGVIFVSINYWPTILLGVLFLIISLPWVYTILHGGRYKPEKSFYWWRLNKEKMQLIYKVVTIIIVIISIPLLILNFKLSVLLSLIGALGGLYLITKSFKVHEDIDYVANQELSEKLGIEIDEKVQASYLKKNIIMLLSDKKIICSYLEGGQWNILNKRIDEITKIGIYTPVMMGSLFNTELYFMLMFTDSTKVELKMDLGDKITSNPDLFFRKFLVTIDAVLLGKVDEKIQSRRRVSVNQENTKATKPVESINDTQGRSIDISRKVIHGIENAIPIESGRIIEL